MSEESNAAPEMSAEVIQVRDALATVETQAGNGDWVAQFKEQHFGSTEDVYKFYASKDDDEQPSGDGGVPSPDDEQPLLAGKFKSPEDLEKAYKALESKLGAPKEEPKDPNEAPKEPQGDLEIKAKESTEAAGLDMDALQQHYNEHGSLSEAHYEALGKAGLSKAAVDSFIGEVAEARATKSQVAANAVFESVGGKENYQSMIQWASGNLSESEISSFNKATNSGDLGLINLAVEGLQSKYKAAVGTGSTGSYVSGASKASQGAAGYEHRDEMIADMNNPKFQTSASFRAQVQKKLERSKF